MTHADWQDREFEAILTTIAALPDDAKARELGFLESLVRAVLRASPEQSAEFLQVVEAACASGDRALIERWVLGILERG